jgi:hypothetical protein
VNSAEIPENYRIFLSNLKTNGLKAQPYSTLSV